MRAVKWIVGAVFTLALLVMVAPFIALAVLDDAIYKNAAIEAVNEATGRTLSLNGDVHASLSLQPTFTLEDASLSNAEWAKDPVFAHVDRASVTLQVLPLLQGEVQIDHITLDGAQVFLQEHSKHGLNLPALKEVEEDQVSEQAEEVAEAAEDAAELRIDAIVLRAVQVSYRAPKQKPLRVTLDEAELQGIEGTAIEQFSLAALLEDIGELQASGSLSEALLTLDATLRAGSGNVVRAQGKVEAPLVQPKWDMKVDADMRTPGSLPNKLAALQALEPL